jgi:hypothetical protein
MPNDTFRAAASEFMHAVDTLDQLPVPVVPEARHVSDHSGLRFEPVQQRPMLVDPVDAAVSGTVTADELVLVMSDGTRETWTRVPAD